MEQTYLPGTVRERVQDQIKERKITQGELAAEIGISESALSRFLSGKTDNSFLHVVSAQTILCRPVLSECGGLFRVMTFPAGISF